MAARAAAALVEDGMTVGLGTGSTVAHLLPALAERGSAGHPLRRHLAGDRGGRRASSASRSRTSSALERLDIAIDGADQVTPDGWLIKGGGGAHLREKIVAGGGRALRRDRRLEQAGRGAEPAGAAGAVRLRPALDPGPARRGRAARRCPRAPTAA